MVENYYADIQATLADFEPIYLEELGKAQLMNRVDTKYIIPISLLPNILQQMGEEYKVLETSQHRLNKYETLYYDTSELTLYHQHQTGKLNRYKIRQRNYVASNLFFTEVKFKNNKGRTHKTRIRQQYPLGDLEIENITKFIEHQTPYQTAKLQPMLWVNYERLTLVNALQSERITIDINLRFVDMHGKIMAYPNIVVVEIKQERVSNSKFADLLKKQGIKSGFMSKYCLGIISLFPAVKSNRFKSKVSHLKKIIERDDFFTTNS